MIDEKYRPVMFANGLKTQTFICRTLFIYIYISMFDAICLEVCCVLFVSLSYGPASFNQN